MKRFAVLSFLLALTLVDACASFHGLAYPSAPGILVSWEGTSERPWTDLEAALVAIEAEAHVSYPDKPELLKFDLLIFGSNDRIDADSTPNVVTSTDGVAHLTIGSTELNDCTTPSGDRVLGLGCSPKIRVRQIRAYASPVKKDTPHVLTFYGPLVDVDVSALFEEVGCRYWMLRLTGKPLYGPGCTLIQQRIRQRYYALRAK